MVLRANIAKIEPRNSMTAISKSLGIWLECRLILAPGHKTLKQPRLLPIPCNASSTAVSTVASTYCRPLDGVLHGNCTQSSTHIQESSREGFSFRPPLHGHYCWSVPLHKVSQDCSDCRSGGFTAKMTAGDFLCLIKEKHIVLFKVEADSRFLHFGILG